MGFLRFIFDRLFLAVVTLTVITAILYAVMMLQTPEERAFMFIPKGANLGRLIQLQLHNYIQLIIEKNGLNDPYPVQYFRWVNQLLHGDWGYSMTLSSDVLDFLSAHAPVTIELTLYTILLIIPAGLVSGAIAGWKRNRAFDYIFRGAAFAAASSLFYPGASIHRHFLCRPILVCAQEIRESGECDRQFTPIQAFYRAGNH